MNSGAHSGVHSGAHSAGPPSRPNEAADESDRPIPIPLYGGAFAGDGARPRGYTSGDPPSPRTLRSLLQALPQDTPGQPTPAEEDAGAAELAGPVPGTANGVLHAPTPPWPAGSTADVPGVAQPTAVNGVAPEDDALKQALGGLYAMWKAGRRVRGADVVQDGETFLQVVQTVVNGA